MLVLVGDWSKTCQGVHVRGPEDLAPELVEAFGQLTQEVLVAFPVGADRRILSCDLVAVGAANVAVVCPRDVFRPAVAVAATGVVIAHNHPSGHTRPSQADLVLSRRMIDAGALLDVEVLDHLIVAPGSWRSLRESTRLWDA